MSKSNSLGSSPIGYSSSGNDQYSFIPDLGVSASQEETEREDFSRDSSSPKQEEEKSFKSNIHKLFSLASAKLSQETKVEKKIVSYNLEKDLIKSLKKLADEHNIYYSTFVSDAIKNWLIEHNYQD